MRLKFMLIFLLISNVVFADGFEEGAGGVNKEKLYYSEILVDFLAKKQMATVEIYKDRYRTMSDGDFSLLLFEKKYVEKAREVLNYLGVKEAYILPTKYNTERMSDIVKASKLEDKANNYQLKLFGSSGEQKIIIPVLTKEKPPKSRYVKTWDVEKIDLNFIFGVKTLSKSVTVINKESEHLETLRLDHLRINGLEYTMSLLEAITAPTLIKLIDKFVEYKVMTTEDMHSKASAEFSFSLHKNKFKKIINVSSFIDESAIKNHYQKAVEAERLESKPESKFQSFCSFFFFK